MVVLHKLVSTNPVAVANDHFFEGGMDEAAFISAWARYAGTKEISSSVGALVFVSGYSISSTGYYRSYIESI